MTTARDFARGVNPEHPETTKPRHASSPAIQRQNAEDLARKHNEAAVKAVEPEPGLKPERALLLREDLATLVMEQFGVLKREMLVDLHGRSESHGTRVLLAALFLNLQDAQDIAVVTRLRQATEKPTHYVDSAGTRRPLS